MCTTNEKKLESQECSSSEYVTLHNQQIGSCSLQPQGGGALPYMGYIGMCRCEGYGFQAVYSRIGYIN